MYKPKEYAIHLLLFVLTIITSTLAGGEWVYGKHVLASGESALTWEYFFKSMAFSIPFIGILLIHELGHFFTSLYHKVRCTLPFFIPAWLGFIGAPSIGTFGAIIRMKGFVNSRIKFFDIGIAGPLAVYPIPFRTDKGRITFYALSAAALWAIEMFSCLRVIASSTMESTQDAVSTMKPPSQPKWSTV